MVSLTIQKIHLFSSYNHFEVARLFNFDSNVWYASMAFICLLVSCLSHFTMESIMEYFPPHLNQIYWPLLPELAFNYQQIFIFVIDTGTLY